MCDGIMEAVFPKGLIGVLWISLFLFPATARSQESLVEDQSVSNTHSPGQVVSYTFDTNQNETYLIEVVQGGLDLDVTLNLMDGSSSTFNSPLQRDGSEFVLVGGQPGGNLQVDVRAEQNTHAIGTHIISIRKILSVGPELDAWAAFSLGAAAYAANEADKALGHYEAAASNWRLLGRPQEEAFALYAVARIKYWDLFDWPGAIQAAKRAASLYEDSDNEQLHARTLFAKGAALEALASELELGEAKETFDEAVSLYDDAAQVFERRGSLYDFAEVKIYTGVAYLNRGELDTAQSYLEQAQPLFADLGEWEYQFQVLQNLAVIDIEKGYSGRAADRLQGILDRLPSFASPEFESDVLTNLGSAYRLAGRFEEALRAYTDALEIHRQTNSRWGQSLSLHGIGSTYYAIGELDLAEDYLERALPIAEEIRDGRGQASILENLGNISYLRTEFVVALQRHEKSFSRTVSMANRPHRLVIVAKDLSALGRHDEANVAATEARAMAEAANVPAVVADSLIELGNSWIRLEEVESGLAAIETAQAIYNELGLRSGQAQAFYSLSVGARKQGDLGKATLLGEAALDTVDLIRAEISAPQLRAQYASTLRRYYSEHIDLLMSRYDAAEPSTSRYVMDALATSERGRSRMLVDLLSGVSVETSVVGDPRIVEERSSLTEELMARISRRDYMLSDGIDGPDASAILSRLRADIDAIENELNLLPATGSISPETLSATEIQSYIDPDTVLLQYFLGENQSVVWVVTSDAIAGHVIEKRSAIESAAIAAFEALNTVSVSPESRRRRNRSLQELSRLVVSPVAHALGNKRILVAADGALQYIPFSVLSRDDGKNTAALYETNDIVIIPSVSVISLQRQRHTAATDNTLIVFADPVFEATDDRFKNRSGEIQPTIPGAADVTTRSSVNSKLVRLNWSAHEARAIAKLMPTGQTVLATGFDASREKVLDMDLDQYRYVHFATHGLIDSRYPALSSLALSLYDANGNSKQGLLRLHDIYDLRLNADVVVLSACETALGREIRGEGLVGITQGFMYAGARRLLVSLWKVDDRATSELMVRFYESLIIDHVEPSAALRGAQISISKNSRWVDPYYWAGFVLLGDWEKRETDGQSGLLSAN